MGGVHDLRQSNINSQGDEVRIHDDAAIDSLPHGRLFREIAQKRARMNGDYGGTFRTIESEIWTVYLEKKAEGTLSDDTHGGYVRVAIENALIDQYRRGRQIPAEERTTRTETPHRLEQIHLSETYDEDGEEMNTLENMPADANISNGIRPEDLSEQVPLTPEAYRQRKARLKKRLRQAAEKILQERDECALVHSKRHGRKVYITRVLGPDDLGDPIFIDPERIQVTPNYIEHTKHSV